MKHSYKMLLLYMTVVLSAGSYFLFSNVVFREKPVTAKSTKSELPAAILGSIQEGLSKREYHISYDAAKKIHQSPNRQNNLRAYYEPGTLTVRNRKDSVDHNFEFKIVNEGIFADGSRLRMEKSESEFEQKENIAEISYGTLTEQYVNSEAGIRQNFIINQAPAGSSKLEVQLSVQGADVRELGDNSLELSPKSCIGNTLTYKDLKCWDTSGNVLAASLAYRNGRISISVDVANATYPVTIDPIIANGNPTNAIKIPEVNQSHAWLGGSVSSAGDVNGDGYSDVIVAASKYDNGQVDEGAAFVYYGSAAGISLVGSVMLQGDQAGARFGCFVSTAGDLNKDGFSDIMIGAHMYDKGQINEGAVFVYHGSAAGIGTNASLLLESNQAEAYFGNALGLAGDVNGDGYSDVVIGARGYDSGQVNEGVAFVYHGSAQGLNANTPLKIEVNQAEAMFGFTATGAGDVNGDGYSDIMVGARLFDKGQVDEGAVFIYHGSALGINANAVATTLESNQVNAYLGHSINTAGDVNGDGYSDIVVSANMYDKGQTNEGAAFVHHGSAQGINPVAAITLEMNQAEAQFGYSVASAGDVNGDGYADVIIGANYYDNGQLNEGAAFVFHGAKTGLAATPVSTLESNKAGSQFGCSVASAGDVNGDGYSDVTVGAIAYDNGHDDEGAVFVWVGGASESIGAPSKTLESNQIKSYMGNAVASAGDVNGDGYSDLLIAAPAYDNGQSDEGIVMIYHGSATGIKNVPTQMLEGDKEDALFGYSISSAGDINGDGFDDIVVGSIFYSNGENHEGAAFVYYGSPVGIQKASKVTLESDQVDGLMGGSTSTAGDVNGDGFSDIIVGVENYSAGQSGEGAAFIYLGSQAGINSSLKTVIESNVVNAWLGKAVSNAGDVNGDGFEDVLIGSPWYNNGNNLGAAFIYYGSQSGIDLGISRKLVTSQNAKFGCSVSCAGDVNADGFDDIIVGSSSFAKGQVAEGAAFIFHGSSEGIKENFAAILESNRQGAEMGNSVKTAGDINGDGYSDVIIGASYWENGQQREGAFAVYLGSIFGVNTNTATIYESNQESSQLGSSVSAAGDLNGDGYGDLAVGAEVYDHGQTDEGAVLIFYGNKGNNLENRFQLYNDDLLTPINQTQFAQNNFGAGLYSKSFLGANRGKLVWETKAAGQGFSKGANNVITNSTQSSGSQNVYASLGLLGTELKNVINKQGTSTKVRVRVKYDPALAHTGQTYGPWRYLSSYLGGGGVSPAPEEQVSPMAETIRRKVVASESVLVYPNPASDRIRIDSKNGEPFASFKLLTSNGKLVLQGGFQQEVDVRDLPAGKYILVTTSSDGSQYSSSVIISK